MPKLSVIVPVYNTEKYLRECINSILAQTFTDFELILIDDGSIDKSGSICDEYAETDSRVRVVHQNNCGVTAARKMGAALSKGDYVTYVDSDDWIDKDTYESVFSNIRKCDADMGIFAMSVEKSPHSIIINCVGEGAFSGEHLQEEVCSKMLFDYSLNCSGVIASLCNKVTKREILQNAINSIAEDLDYGEDAISGYLCILNAETITISNTPFYHYRDNPSSISHANSWVMKKRIVALDCEMRRCFSGYAMDMSDQINGHIARHTVEQVRNDLLCSNDKSFFKRCRTALEFCKKHQITSALKKAYPLIRNKKEKVKVLLIRCRLLGLLYILFKKV